jgi:hypothetical protein
LGINEVKKLVIACAAMALFGSAAHAEPKLKMVEEWAVSSQHNAFNKGGIYFIATGDYSFKFAVRCLQKQPSFGIFLHNDRLRPGQLSPSNSASIAATSLS